MSKDLVIVFVKNLEVGTVKTRLAETIGPVGAYEVYKHLVELTESVTTNLDTDKHIYFSKNIVDDLWPNEQKFVQSGVDLGERMHNAFKNGFNLGYERIVLIGSDLPDLTSSLVEDAFSKLNTADITFGPAEDGGYYLVGMNKLVPKIFKDKPWSQPNLLKVTMDELNYQNYSVAFLNQLNDIDSYEDLITSEFYRSNRRLQEKIKQLHD